MYAFLWSSLYGTLYLNGSYTINEHKDFDIINVFYSDKNVVVSENIFCLDKTI